MTKKKKKAKIKAVFGSLMTTKQTGLCPDTGQWQRQNSNVVLMQQVKPLWMLNKNLF